MDKNFVKFLKKYGKNYPKITLLTGAGVSVLSEIPDFKSLNKKYYNKERSREEVFSLKFFQNNPQKFWKNFKEVYTLFQNKKPNYVHTLIKELENYSNVTVITQNIDKLHNNAGSKNVIELHGNIEELKCSRQSCKTLYKFNDYKNSSFCPRCKKCKKFLRPNIVLFGEKVNNLKNSVEEVNSADLFIVIGTSLDVSPANQLPFKISPQSELMWVNKHEFPEGYYFTYTFLEEF